MKKIIVALSGASGIQYGVELLKSLQDKDIELHLVISEWAKQILKSETEYKLEQIIAFAKKHYDNAALDAPIASSSFIADGMVIVPCSVKTLSEIANALTGSLITRAADNMLKMRKKLIIGLRETPLSTPALEQMYKLSRAGAIILPLAPAFYHRPENLQDLFAFMTGKILDCLQISNNEFKRWQQ